MSVLGMAQLVSGVMVMCMAALGVSLGVSCIGACPNTADTLRTRGSLLALWAGGVALVVVVVVVVVVG